MSSPAVMMGGVARFEVPGGWAAQAFAFALDCTPEQEACLRRQFGGRRYARNWTVRTLKEDLNRYHAAGQETEKPSLAGLRKRWNQAKDTECRDRETGEAWWPEISKEAFADGIKAAVDGYWNWQQSRAGERAGKRDGFPPVREKGKRPGQGHVHHRARSGSSPTGVMLPSRGSGSCACTRAPGGWSGCWRRGGRGSWRSRCRGRAPGWSRRSGSWSGGPSSRA